MSSPPSHGSRFSRPRNWALFIREALTDPRSIGACLPSSPSLGRRMAGFVNTGTNGLVIELGAGTGAVTEALLAHGIDRSRLLVVERSTPLADVLRERFPGVTIHCGDAAQLGTIVRSIHPGEGAIDIVSSLPLRSLPADKVRAILNEIATVLDRGGRWIQFTYALATRHVPEGFLRQGTSFVWGNIPPARVDVFTRSPGTPSSPH